MASLTSGMAGRGEGFNPIRIKKDMFNLYIRLFLTYHFFKILWSLDMRSQPDCSKALLSPKVLDKIFEAENDKRDKKKI